MKPETWKRLSFAALGAAALSVTIAPVSQTPGRHWTDRLLLFAYWVGTLASSNVHQPNETVTWAALFIVVLVILYGFLSIAAWARSLWRNRV